MLIKDNKINFSNLLFDNIMKSIDVIDDNEQITDEVLDFKIFQLFKDEISSDPYQNSQDQLFPLTQR